MRVYQCEEGMGGGKVLERLHEQDLVCGCDTERTPSWSYKSGLDS